MFGFCISSNLIHIIANRWAVNFSDEKKHLDYDFKIIYSSDPYWSNKKILDYPYYAIAIAEHKSNNKMDVWVQILLSKEEFNSFF